MDLRKETIAGNLKKFKPKNVDQRNRGCLFDLKNCITIFCKKQTLEIASHNRQNSSVSTCGKKLVINRKMFICKDCCITNFLAISNVV